MPADRPIHDPRLLRAIAHPVRTQILGEIAAGGPTRAADLARVLDIPANQASFHLRQLAKYGLVEEAPEEARDKRDRVWKASSESGLRADLSELSKAPGGRAAVAVFRRNTADWAHHLIDLVLSDGPSGDKEEDAIRTMMNQTVKLTKAEAEEMATELADLVESWVARTRGRDDVARRTYLLMQVLQPQPRLDEA
ncbi:DNA-binding transcriptional ArsR family regulator [Nocardioides ginsengisegetis]|uniref:DNA-binding transcriptional ArsR family regulator n=1 Tax=Nocardioides ginsengisegetis TaxID=661491 RepID=A0A7W3IW37_9ACTN|nr:helix-turn-helix domain-containing protein [Nocardioides ginsengisegetis]MBA8801737.1 DNA-binding transcriptional ArsR family regulator [Nocardioides ginsengisegetis]